MNLDHMAVELRAAMDAEPPALETLYAPDRLPEVREEIAALEDELDVAWPGWRRREPFNHLADQPLVFVKLRLKRLDLLRHGRADWGMRVVRIEGKLPVVVPVRPTRSRREIAQVAQIWEAPASPSILAERLGVPLADVENAIAEVRDRGERVTRRAIRMALRGARAVA